MEANSCPDSLPPTHLPPPSKSQQTLLWAEGWQKGICPEAPHLSECRASHRHSQERPQPFHLRHEGT